MANLCKTCKSARIEEIVKENHRYFYCNDCKTINERSLNTDYGKDVVVASNEGIIHLCAGGLLRKNNKVLMLKRRVYAFGYSFPAGHLEYKEKPFETLKREVLEETALHLKEGKLIFEGEVPNHKCRYGADRHIWYFYDCTFVPGTVVLNPESETYGWYTADEVAKLDLVPQATYLFENVVRPLL